MNIDTILLYIDQYGSIIIFLLLFLGIVGIPAPEESLLFLIGVLIAHHQLSMGIAILTSVSGAYIGMITAYICGRFAGYPLIKKYGKYIGITEQRWRKISSKYEENTRKTILLGFYMPGIRQISPYFAGISKISYKRFLLFSLLGTCIWTLPFIIGGYFAGRTFNIDPAYAPYLGIAFLVIFLLFTLSKYIRRKRDQIMQK